MGPCANVREAVLRAFRAALIAVDPASCTADALQRMNPDGPITIVAMGKAAVPMADSAVACLGTRVVGGIAIAPEAGSGPELLELAVGSHPSPDHRSEAAAARALELVRQAAPDTTLLCLVSGGGSALAEVPAEGITIEESAATMHALMNHGVPIGDLNLLRRHLSKVKDGRLLEAFTGRAAITLILSDVIDGPPSDVASGPTLADGTTPADALAMLRRHRLGDIVPAAVTKRLGRTRRRTRSATPHVVEVVADGARAANAAVESLAADGVAASMLPEPLRGDAIDVARHVPWIPRLQVAWGETTMSVTGTGRGGRNQAAALAAAIEIDGSHPRLFAALATDGIDGPTEAAGAIVDHTTAATIRAAGITPLERLEDDDSYAALRQADALVTTGPTGTNVADLWMWGGC